MWSNNIFSVSVTPRLQDSPTNPHNRTGLNSFRQRETLSNSARHVWHSFAERRRFREATDRKKKKTLSLMNKTRRWPGSFFRVWHCGNRLKRKLWVCGDFHRLHGNQLLAKRAPELTVASPSQRAAKITRDRYWWTAAILSALIRSQFQNMKPVSCDLSSRRDRDLTSVTTSAMSCLSRAVRSGAIFTRTGGLCSPCRASRSLNTWPHRRPREVKRGLSDGYIKSKKN